MQVQESTGQVRINLHQPALAADLIAGMRMKANLRAGTCAARCAVIKTASVVCAVLTALAVLGVVLGTLLAPQQGLDLMQDAWSLAAVICAIVFTNLMLMMLRSECEHLRGMSEVRVDELSPASAEVVDVLSLWFKSAAHLVSFHADVQAQGREFIKAEIRELRWQGYAPVTAPGRG